MPVSELHREVAAIALPATSETINRKPIPRIMPNESKRTRSSDTKPFSFLSGASQIRSRSWPSATRAWTGIVSVPTSTTVSGSATRLWYQPGFTGEPPLVPKTAKSSPTAR